MIFNTSIYTNTMSDLPKLSNAGTASDLLQGKQLIDQYGNVLTGTLPGKEIISSTIQIKKDSTVPDAFLEYYKDENFTSDTLVVTNSYQTITAFGVAFAVYTNKSARITYTFSPQQSYQPKMFSSTSSTLTFDAIYLRESGVSVYISITSS